MPQLTIVTALVMEAREMARAFCLPASFQNKVQIGEKIAVAIIGPGARHLDAVRTMVPKGLILAGLGGGLSPELGMGDVVIHGDVPAVLPGAGHRMFVGPVATAESIVSTPEEKAALYRQTNALAVDMETAHVQFLANSLQIPYLVVRGISDTAMQTLDADLLTLVDADGKPRMGRALRLLARRPSRLREMLALQRASKLALANVATTVRAIVAAGWPQTL